MSDSPIDRQRAKARAGKRGPSRDRPRQQADDQVLVATRTPVVVRNASVALALVGSVLFLFARLGHYALWDDEALTALPALNVWRTGDTSLVLGSNIIACRDGTMMTNLHDRTYQPLMYYLAAPSLGLLGRNAWAARFPFALCGLGCVALMLRWAWRERVDPVTWVLLSLALLGNVSFFLYSRQCRYYAPMTFLSVAIVYVYRFHDGRHRSLVALALLSLGLLATNLMNYVALYAALAVDYAFWGRKRRSLSATDWLWVLVPQVALGAPLIAVYNPWNAELFNFPHENWFVAKSTLLYRNFRDLNRCEFGILPLIALTPVLSLKVRRDWLVRAPLVLLVYVLAVTVASPQPMSMSKAADIRYLAPIIPLCMTIGVLALRVVAGDMLLLAIPVGLVAFGTNMLNLDPFLRGGFQSTVCEFVTELAWPPDDPYAVTATWLNAHVEPGQSVCALPVYTTYPLMFHAPAPVFAWQLPLATDKKFAGLAPIHFRGKVLPDYFVAFGPQADNVRKMLPSDAPIRYELIETLDIFWRDVYRPELFWRSFRPVTGYDTDRDAIYVFRKTDASLP